MTQIIHRNAMRTPPTAVRGQGVYVFDENNRSYLDACGGAAVSCLGYNHPAPIEAIQKQAENLAYIHSGFFTSQVAEDLAERLVELTPAPLNHVVFFPVVPRRWKRLSNLGDSIFSSAANRVDNTLFPDSKAFTATRLAHYRLATTPVAESPTSRFSNLPIRFRPATLIDINATMNLLQSTAFELPMNWKPKLLNLVPTTSSALSPKPLAARRQEFCHPCLATLSEFARFAILMAFCSFLTKLCAAPVERVIF